MWRQHQPRIFLSYRRADTLGYAGRLEADLRRLLGPNCVFKDQNSIVPGERFPERINTELAQCTDVLVLIGKRWLDLRSENGVRRIDEPDDIVRMEIRMALERPIRVIPTLLEGAPLPSDTDLPNDIRDLTRRQWVEISDTRWDYDVRRLAGMLAPSRHWISQIAVALAVVGTALAYALWPTRAFEGTYQCRTSAHLLTECHINKNDDGALELSFEGPKSGTGGLVDTYRGRIEIRGCGFSTTLVNTFSADGSPPRLIGESHLTVACTSATQLTGSWTSADGSRPFEMTNEGP